MREIIEQLEFKLWEKDQVIFRKQERADNAYLIVFGELNFYDEIPHVDPESKMTKYEQNRNSSNVSRRSISKMESVDKSKSNPGTALSSPQRSEQDIPGIKL